MALSETQQLAVQTVGKNVCVSAGAGSGKTLVLVERFLYLVKEKGISPSRILAVTFTEKAANEMKRRIVHRLREEGLEAARREVENAAIGTFHAFSARILREHPLEAGVDPHFVILESEEAEALQREVLEGILEGCCETDAEVFNLLRIYKETSVQQGVLGAYRASRNSVFSFEELLKRRSGGDRDSFEKELARRLKEADLPPAGEKPFQTSGLLTLKSSLRAVGKNKEAIRRLKDFLEESLAFLREESCLPLREVFIRLALEFEKAYEAAKRTTRALDFDDLQIRAVRLLGAEAPISRYLRRIYQEKFSEILVDEFQDTNPLQDRLLELIRREDNLFIVGDFMQSIYGFRGTEVEIFLRKEKAFRQDSTGLGISLTENHRTRPRLIDFINCFFEALWREDGLPFEALVAERDEPGEGPRVEWLALEKGKEEDADEIRIREARTLARRIESLVKEEDYLYREIACLFDAMTPSHFYEQEFRRAGIPYYVVSSRDFHSQPEVRDVVSFLRALENPKEDIPLAAALRSPLFQVSDDTLFWLARSAKEKTSERRGPVAPALQASEELDVPRSETPLGEGMRVFESLPEITPAEKEKLRFFQDTFAEFLSDKEKLGISELIEKLLHRTGYDLYVLKLRQGERRFANLRKLVEIARAMESKQSLHLGDFVRAVRALETREVRESQAQVEAEAGDVVRLMSIHRSKGLEFPVVILPDLGGRENQEGGNFLLSEEGLGLRVWDEEAGDFLGTLTYQRIKRRKDRLTSEESKRKLYVAMTRAREKLILAGPRRLPDPKRVSFHDLATWAEWVERILGEGTWEVQKLAEAPYDPFPFEKRKALAERRPLRAKLENLIPIRLREVPKEAERILENILPPPQVEFERIDLPVSAFLLFAKDPEAYFSIYELGASSGGQGRALEIKSEDPPPEEEGLSSAEFGTRAHQILEHAFLRRVKASELRPMVDRFNRDLGVAEKEDIYELAKRFLAGKEAQEILKSSALYPELSFVLRLPHGLVYGTLDLIYRNPAGKWILLDYKTSRVDEESFRKRGEEYRAQLELYALALWQIIGEPPLEARIHFLRPGLIYPLPFLAGDFSILLEKYTRIQKEILKFRRERTLASAGGG